MPSSPSEIEAAAKDLGNKLSTLSCEDALRQLRMISSDLEVAWRNSWSQSSSSQGTVNSCGTTDLIGYVSDIEGNWEFFQRYIMRSQVLYFKADGSVDLRPGAKFVFGGDAVDKWIGDMRVVGTLTNLKKTYPDRVFLVGGNRDFNKMRYTSELSDEELQLHPSEYPKPHWVNAPLDAYLAQNKIDPDSDEAYSRTVRLKYMLANTMGCADTFEFRRVELTMKKANMCGVSTEDVTDSIYKSVQDGGWMREFIQLLDIAVLIDDMLFVHGGLSPQNFGRIPGMEGRIESVQEWVEAINAWKTQQVQDWLDHPTWEDLPEDLERFPSNEGSSRPADGRDRGGDGLMDYGLPNGCKGDTVIYASYLADNHPQYVAPDVRAWLSNCDVKWIMVGHAPQGDSPTVIAHYPDHAKNLQALRVINYDTSYSDVKTPDMRGKALADCLLRKCGGAREAWLSGVFSDGVEWEYGFGGLKSDQFIGRETKDNRWVKAKLKTKPSEEEKYLVFKGKGRVQEKAMLTKRELVDLMP